jgi:hypothetical protein
MQALQTKGGIEFYPFLKAPKNSAKSVIVAQLTVPFGTVRRSAGLRPGTKLENIEHPTSNAEHRSFCPFLFNSMFDVGCSVFDVPIRNHAGPEADAPRLFAPRFDGGIWGEVRRSFPGCFQGVTTR